MSKMILSDPLARLPLRSMFYRDDPKYILRQKYFFYIEFMHNVFLLNLKKNKKIIQLKKRISIIYYQ